MEQDLVTIVGDDGIRTPDPVFTAKLAKFDSSLFVFWNKMRRRWVIAQCISHRSAACEHTVRCKHSIVWMVQSPEKTMLGLGDHVFEKLRQMQLETEKFGGPTERGLRNYREHCESVQQELKNKEAEKMREVARLNSLDHRVQLNRARMLLQRHDLRINQ
jgi:hypothetical protein